MDNFEKNVRKTFEKHGLENKQLESVVTDLFNSFKTQLMHDTNFIDSIENSIERNKRTKEQFR